MQQVLHILKKEFYSYFLSPIAYIVISIFLVVTGWFFFSTFFIYNLASMRNFFAMMPIIFFAEKKKSKNIQRPCS